MALLACQSVPAGSVIGLTATAGSRQPRKLNPGPPLSHGEAVGGRATSGAGPWDPLDSPSALRLAAFDHRAGQAARLVGSPSQGRPRSATRPRRLRPERHEAAIPGCPLVGRCRGQSGRSAESAEACRTPGYWGPQRLRIHPRILLRRARRRGAQWGAEQLRQVSDACGTQAGRRAIAVAS